MHIYAYIFPKDSLDNAETHCAEVFAGGGAFRVGGKAVGEGMIDAEGAVFRACVVMIGQDAHFYEVFEGGEELTDGIDLAAVQIRDEGDAHLDRGASFVKVSEVFEDRAV